MTSAAESMAMSEEFDMRALYEAVDAQRQASRLNWAQVAREVGVSASTLRALRERRTVEADGVLQVLGWLQRSPESFVSGEGRRRDVALPTAGGGVLRFDARSVYAALNARRAELGMTWRQVAAASGADSAAGLTRLREGGRVSFPAIMNILTWLGEPAARFVRVARR